MPNRKRHALDRRAQPGQGHEVAGVAIARHDLGGHHFRMQAQGAQRANFNLRVQAGVGSHRAGQLAHRDLLPRQHQGASRAADLAEKAGEHQASRDGLGVDAVRATNHQRVAMLFSLARERLHELVDADHDLIGCLAQQDG